MMKQANLARVGATPRHHPYMVLATAVCLSNLCQAAAPKTWVVPPPQALWSVAADTVKSDQFFEVPPERFAAAEKLLHDVPVVSLSAAH